MENFHWISSKLTNTVKFFFAKSLKICEPFYIKSESFFKINTASTKENLENINGGKAMKIYWRPWDKILLNKIAENLCEHCWRPNLRMKRRENPYLGLDLGQTRLWAKPSIDWCSQTVNFVSSRLPLTWRRLKHD